MIKAAIFDIDGTLIDSVDAHAQAWTSAFKAHGVDVDLEAMRRQVGMGADKVLPLCLPPAEVARLGPAIEARQHAIFRDQYLDTLLPFANVRPLFERLRADGVRRVLASSAKPADAKRYQAIADLEELVDAVATADDADRSKPSPDIVKAALKQISPIEPSQCLFVGDTPYDAQAAAEADVASVGVLTGAFLRGELRAAGCRAVHRDITDLLEHYDAVFG